MAVYVVKSAFHLGDLVLNLAVGDRIEVTPDNKISAKGKTGDSPNFRNAIRAGLVILEGPETQNIKVPTPQGPIKTPSKILIEDDESQIVGSIDPVIKVNGRAINDDLVPQVNTIDVSDSRKRNVMLPKMAVLSDYTDAPASAKFDPQRKAETIQVQKIASEVEDSQIPEVGEVIKKIVFKEFDNDLDGVLSEVSPEPVDKDPTRKLQLVKMKEDEGSTTPEHRYPVEDHWKTRIKWIKDRMARQEITLVEVQAIYDTSTDGVKIHMKKEFPFLT